MPSRYVCTPEFGQSAIRNPDAMEGFLAEVCGSKNVMFSDRRDLEKDELRRACRALELDYRDHMETIEHLSKHSHALNLKVKQLEVKSVKLELRCKENELFIRENVWVHCSGCATELKNPFWCEKCFASSRVEGTMTYNPLHDA